MAIKLLQTWEDKENEVGLDTEKSCVSDILENREPSSLLRSRSSECRHATLLRTAA